MKAKRNTVHPINYLYILITQFLVPSVNKTNPDQDYVEIMCCILLLFSFLYSFLNLSDFDSPDLSKSCRSALCIRREASVVVLLNLRVIWSTSPLVIARKGAFWSTKQTRYFGLDGARRGYAFRLCENVVLAKRSAMDWSSPNGSQWRMNNSPFSAR